MRQRSGGLELLVERRDEKTLLLSPGVGLFASARPRGTLLAAGEEAGVLSTLGRSRPLLVAPGVAGRVTSPAPPLMRQPVGWGDVLYELARLADAEAIVRSEVPVAAEQRGRLLFLSPQSGRFYHRPAPDEPPFVAPGATIQDGAPVGLIEVMKTFAQVRYEARGPLPRRAKIVALLVEDGAEVESGQPLLEVEAAGEPA